LSKATPCK